MRIVFSLLALLLLNACAAAVVGGAVETGQRFAEDRRAEDQLLDAKIYAAFNQKLIELDKELYFDVSLDVYEQRAMLTGTLDNNNTLAKIQEMLYQDERIKEVINEVQLVTPATKNNFRSMRKAGDSVSQGSSDLWIEAKIKTQLVANKYVHSVNYRWKSVNNRVYILGRSVSQGELDQVLSTIRAVKGVNSLRSHIIVRP